MQFICYYEIDQSSGSKVCETVIETVGEEEAKLLPDLDIGEALICGQCVQFPILVKIKSPDSQGKN